MNLNKEQLTRAYTIIDGKNAKISQLEKERDELKARLDDAEMACSMANHRIEELEGDVEELKKLLELVSPLARYSLEESKQ